MLGTSVSCHRRTLPWGHRVGRVIVDDAVGQKWLDKISGSQSRHEIEKEKDGFYFNNQEKQTIEPHLICPVACGKRDRQNFSIET